MSEIIISASTFLHNISHIFSGTYKSSNEEYNAMKNEVYDLSIPSIEEDRKNSHSDMINIGNDLKKSVKEYGQKVRKSLDKQ